MIGNHFSLILLPTNKCNVACEYCFEDNTNDFMSHERLAIVIDKLLDHMERKAIASMTVYWQGGEIMLLPPVWFERAYEMIQQAAAARGKRITHSLQSNMMGYHKRWNTIIAEMFGNSAAPRWTSRTSITRQGRAWGSADCLALCLGNGGTAPFRQQGIWQHG
jgi:sulfatase maturation enzyme AslB (radical SAM superfamily)